ncbi:glycerophosphodiester phosphodiesterase [Geomicrobium sediminis]|uniref:Glycerophosphoryl diester phosphodiesterase n=1 Tax=Geomicrobium sediminis TaxID=1347788 RepID=A0ABS2PJG8_9BACL|nr:glycerophosphodiester phosphodiesterase family protein [Geomicrobium sediminis]MBM7634963.1 glycerophosphoryl diester phosphodiesterase [Geomicrobium sediminis]
MKTMKKILACGVLGVLLLPQTHGYAQVTTTGDDVTNVAHRGASGHAPENTIAAFDKAVEIGADYIEVDVHMSKNNEVVVIHDATVNRTTDGEGRVNDFTLRELHQLDAGSWFSDEYKGEQIPTLGEVLDRYLGEIGILIEVKDPANYNNMERFVAIELIKRQLRKPTDEEVIVQSFDHASMERFHNILPDVPIGVLVSNNPNGISDEQLKAFQTYADYTNPNHLMVDQDLVTRIQDHGMQISTWTVNDPNRMEELVEYGVDGIITDFPDRLQDVLQ